MHVHLCTVCRCVHPYMYSTILCVHECTMCVYSVYCMCVLLCVYSMCVCMYYVCVQCVLYVCTVMCVLYVCMHVHVCILKCTYPELYIHAVLMEVIITG